MNGALGIFGGSFDPPHVGHVLTACYTLCTGDIERLWVVPTYAHPFGKSLTRFEDRLRMCELAFGGLRHCQVSDIERELTGTSYTVELLEAIAKREPGRPLRLVLGTDILPQTSRWRDFERVAELAPPLVVQRGGHPHPDVPEGAPQMPEVSSSEVRARLGSGRATTGLIPYSVHTYVLEHGLYGSAS